jgi:L-erythro-3,5-diaminohexanoate dehydrogenase
VPGDLPLRAAMSAFDVYPAASHVRALARAGDRVLILGAGHAGLLAAAAASEAEAIATVVDVAPAALERARATARTVLADAADTLAVLRELSEPADLTLVCTSVPGCEGTAIAATRDSGTVLFFSTATSFAAAALGADGISSRVKLVIPNGYTDDRGAYALELLRRRPGLLG